MKYEILHQINFLQTQTLKKSGLQSNNDPISLSLSLSGRVQLSSCCNASGSLFLTQKNSEVKQNVTYETRPNVKYKLRPDVYRKLPQVRLSQDFSPASLLMARGVFDQAGH